MGALAFGSWRRIGIVLSTTHGCGPVRRAQPLRAPRAELSCSNVKPQVYPSPDGTLRAVVYPVDISLNATPDMESRVVIRTSKGDTLTSKDYASPRGFNGYYVVNAKWSPDSKFFVYSMSSSGGHSPWQFPTAVYGRATVLRAIQRYDQRRADSVRGFQVHRAAHARHQHVEQSGSLDDGSRHRGSGRCVLQVAALFGLGRGLMGRSAAGRWSEICRRALAS